MQAQTVAECRQIEFYVANHNKNNLKLWVQVIHLFVHKLNKIELMEILKEYIQYNDFNILSRKLYLQVEDSKDVIILLEKLKQLKQDILKYDENFRDSEIKNNIHSLTNQYYLLYYYNK